MNVCTHRFFSQVINDEFFQFFQCCTYLRCHVRIYCASVRDYGYAVSWTSTWTKIINIVTGHRSQSSVHVTHHHIKLMYIHPPVGATDLMVINEICFVAGHHRLPIFHMTHYRAKHLLEQLMGGGVVNLIC